MRRTTQPLILLRTTVENIQQNPVIIYPTIILAFIQFLTLEVLYFAPRYPLSNFFGPLISHIWSEEFLHYPMDLVLLPKIFYYAQIIIYLFLGNLLLAVTVHLVATIDTHHRPHMKKSLKEAAHFYAHIFCSSVISLILFQFLSSIYSDTVKLILNIKSPGALILSVQKSLLWATPYIQFMIGILITLLLIYVIPIIILEKKKIHQAILLNFKTLFKSFNISLFVVLLPTMFYLPVLVARNNSELLVNLTIPEIQVFVIVLSVLITMAIDLLIITTITTHYLFLKENE